MALIALKFLILSFIPFITSILSSTPFLILYGGIISYMCYLILSYISLYFYMKKQINLISNNWSHFQKNNYDGVVKKIYKIDKIFNDVYIELKKLFPFDLFFIKNIKNNITILKSNLYYLNMFIEYSLNEEDILKEFNINIDNKESRNIILHNSLTRTFFIGDIIKDPIWKSNNKLVDKKYNKHIKNINKEFYYDDLFNFNIKKFNKLEKLNKLNLINEIETWDYLETDYNFEKEQEKITRYKTQTLLKPYKK